MKRILTVGAGVSAAALALALGPAGSALGQNGHEHSMGKSRAAGSGSGGGKLSYHGGIGGVGVEHNAKLYIVYYGTQWVPRTTTTTVNGGTYTLPTAASDPSGEAPYQLNFLAGLEGPNENWSTSTTQYCDGSVATGATSCPSGAGFVVHPTSNPVVATWFDTQHGAAVDNAGDSEVQTAAKDAAAYFATHGGYDPKNAEFIIDTPHNANLAGFYTQYCAYHDYEAYNGSNIAFTNMPYLTDQGASCGQNFVNKSNGLLDGVSIVGGHEYAESVSDHYPNTAWADSRLYENGDKCAWISPGRPGGAANVSTADGSFPVQSLWSNTLGTKGGCAIYYVSASNQHG